MCGSENKVFLPHETINRPWSGRNYNPGQNIWQKWRFIPLPPISMLFAPIHVFLGEDFPENSNIDIVGGTSVPNN